MLRKVIWAVDAFEAPGLLQRHVARFFKQLIALSPRSPPIIEALYLLTPNQLSLPVGEDPNWFQRYREIAENSIQSLLERCELDSYATVTVLSEESITVGAATLALSNYASETGADWIVVNTHGRMGIERLLIGSFAENLITHSAVPVLTIGPFSDITRDLRQVLHPCTLDSDSKSVFRTTVDLAQSLDCRLTLLHVMVPSMAPVLPAGAYGLGNTWLPASTFDIKRPKRRAEAWACWARDQGIRMQALVERKSGSIADVILETAHARRSGMIWIESRSGPMSSFILGSVARQVIRHAECPVLVFGPRFAAPLLKARAA